MKCRVLLVLLLATTLVRAQNLVINPGFEELDFCPNGLTNIEAATSWQSFRLTPDCYNECAEHPETGVPDNYFSESCFPVDGSGYGGFVMMSIPSGFSEVLAVELSEELEVGQEYYVRYYVRRGIPPNNNCWTDQIGARFTVTDYQDWPQNVTMPITNEAHILYSGQISESENWVLVDGYFTADSAYTYLAIGNHFDRDSLNISCDQLYTNYQAYYFVDALCVAVDPEECENFVGIQESTLRQSVQVFPNPIQYELQIVNSRGTLGSIQIYDSLGKLIVERNGGNQTESIPTSQWASGLYVVLVEDENGNQKPFKVVKQ